MPGLNTILLAEDEENDVFLFERALRKAGITHPLVVAHDGQEAVDLLEANPYNDAALTGPPALVVLDLKMPRMNGFEVLSWMKSKPALQQVPVVILSSSSLAADMQKARELGAVDYRIKSSSTAELVQVMQEFNARWLQPGGAAASDQAAISART